MTPTRARTLLLIVVLAAAVTWALLDAVYASLPPLTWTGVPALLIGAGAEAWTGRDLRARIQGNAGRGRRRRSSSRGWWPSRRRSSQTAALLAGICAGFMIYLSDMAGAPTPRADLVDASLSFGACLVLLAAALFLEYCCRVPAEPRRRGLRPAPTPESPFHH